MKAFKYTKIDIVRMKWQFISMFLFGVLAYGFMLSSESTISGLGYLVFAAVLMEGAVFTMEQRTEVGFVNLLPGTDREKVKGRYLTGLVFLVLGIILVGISTGILVIQDKIQLEYFLEQMMIMLGVGLIFLSAQNVVFYIIGRGKSQQLMSLIHMTPGFVMIIVMAIVTSLLEETSFMNKITWMMEHLFVIAVFVLVVGILSYIIGIFISEKIVSKKDFA